MKATFLVAAAVLLAAVTANAQPRVTLPITNQAWVTPFPGFKIVGSVYYVGTQDLAAYLIATNEGLILRKSAGSRRTPSPRAVRNLR